MNARTMTKPVPDIAVDQATDETLLARVAARDMSAFEVLFKNYYRRVYQFVYRMAREPQLTDEIANDVMVVVWERAGQFRAESSASTWILGIAYRRGLKALEKRQRQRRLDGDDVFDTLADEHSRASPEKSMEASERMKRIQHSILSLSVEQQGVVELTALGYTYPEIATIVGCPENTVKTRMFHARRKLRTLLGDALNN